MCKIHVPLVLIIALLVCSLGLAEDTVVIRGGRVVPMGGAEIDEGNVLIENGKIVSVGAHVDIPTGAEIIDAAGKWVLPGMIEAHTTLGAVEGYESSSTDETSDPSTPQMMILDAVNPFNKKIEQVRMAGITSVMVTPGRMNVIGGQSAVVKLRGKTVTQMMLLSPAGVKMSLGEGPKSAYGSKGSLPSTRMGSAFVIRKSLTEAREYVDRWNAYEKKKGKDEDAEPPKRDLKMEPLAELLRGSLSAFIECYRVDDIATALRLIDEFELKAVLVGCAEGYRLAEEIAKRKIPVIVSPFGVGPRRTETAELTIENAAKMHEAGVRVVIKSDDALGVGSLRELPLAAALAVKGGLAREPALRAITLSAAEVLGVADRIGSLEPGKDADIVLFDGDPIHYRTRVVRVLIDGETVFPKPSPE
jgi:imidazolonepropionase-like amidohydrolase